MFPLSVGRSVCLSHGSAGANGLSTLHLPRDPAHTPLTVSGLTELRLSVPETGRRLLPLPVAAWHKDVGKRALKGLAKGDDVLVHGQLVRRFYRSGAGARSLTEVVASGIKKLERVEPE
jgi:hypothetical protein